MRAENGQTPLVLINFIPKFKAISHINFHKLRDFSPFSHNFPANSATIPQIQWSSISKLHQRQPVLVECSRVPDTFSADSFGVKAPADERTV